MKRLTSDNTFEMNMHQLALNQVYIGEDGWVQYVEGPDRECGVCDLVRAVSETLGVELPMLSDEALSDLLLDWLQYGAGEPEGVVAILYRALCAMAEVRAKLFRYEDTGLEPEEIKVILERYHAFRSAISDETGQPMVSWTRAGEICRADKDGRLVVLPCRVRAKLFRYEDTGLEPCDYAAMRAAMDQAEEAKQQLSDVVSIIGCSDINRLKEFAKAEKDGRLVVLPLGKARWIDEILAERKRQDKKWGYPQKNTYCEWASILSEEAGELAQALNELNFGRGSQVQMEMEAVQVAAVALSILEQSAVAHVVTTQAAVALGRPTREEAEAALKKREEAGH